MGLECDATLFYKTMFEYVRYEGNPLWYDVFGFQINNYCLIGFKLWCDPKLLVDSCDGVCFNDLCVMKGICFDLNAFKSATLKSVSGLRAVKGRLYTPLYVYLHMMTCAPGRVGPEDLRKVLKTKSTELKDFKHMVRLPCKTAQKTDSADLKLHQFWASRAI